MTSAATWGIWRNKSKTVLKLTFLEVAMPTQLKHVYCFQVGSSDCYKIGHSKDPEKRKRGLETGSREKLHRRRDIETDNALGLEKYIHQLLALKRAPSGEFFNVTEKELDDALNLAQEFMKEFQPLFDEAKKLRRKKTSNTILKPPDEMLETYQRLRELSREKYFIEQQIGFLASKIQVAIGENLGMAGIALWKWREAWRMDVVQFKRDHPTLYDKYKRDISGRVFHLERVDAAKTDVPPE